MTVIRSKKITNHAEGQPCTARFEGECNGDPSTTVWCHLNGFAFGKGMALKSNDVFGFFGCSSCHKAYDQGRNRTGREADLLRAVCETWTILIRDNIIFVHQDAPKPPKQVVRKPRGQRAPIQGRKDWPKGPKLQSRNDLSRK